MAKTINVEIRSRKFVPKYGTYLISRKKFMAHDESEVANMGDLVRIIPGKKRSKMKHFELADIAVLSAAVADYRPAHVAAQKIKKKGENMTIELEKTPDIAASLGKLKRHGQFIVGFALETNDELQNASEKLTKKNFDFIVLNSLQDAGAGFNFDTNKITILHRDNKRKDFELKTKAEVAMDIVDEVFETVTGHQF